jgi:hypothetical protein
MHSDPQKSCLFTYRYRYISAEKLMIQYVSRLFLSSAGSFQQRQRLVAHSTALESITAEVDDAAMADMVDETETVDKVSAWGGIPAKNAKGENLLLFIGGCQCYFFL